MDSEQTFIASGEDVHSLPGYVYVGFSSNSEKGLELYKDWRTLRIIGAKQVQELHQGRGLINLAVKKDEWDHPKKYEGEGIPDTHPFRALIRTQKHLPIPVQKKATPKKITSKVGVKVLSAPSLKKEKLPQTPAQATVEAVPLVAKANQSEIVNVQKIVTEKVVENHPTITLYPNCDSKCTIKVTIGADGKRVKVNELFFRSSGKHIGELKPGTYGVELLIIENSKYLAFDTSTVPLSFVTSLAALEQRMRPEAGYQITIKGLDKDKLPQK